jgi:D-alanyl-D-alanine carboxypeptidase
MKNTLLLSVIFLLANCQEAVSNQADTDTDTVQKGNFKVAELVERSKVDSLPDLDSLPVWPSILTTRYLSGRFTAKERDDIIAVPKALTDGDGTYYLHAEALAAFTDMYAAAKKDGVNLKIVSAFRNFNRQKSIWEAKWNGQRLLEGKEKANEVYPDPAQRALAILRYSSMPGSSRHHWGTDLDLNRLNNEYFASGEGKKTYDWLKANASTYNFCQPYTALGDKRPHGYQEEKWHWSYLPIARQLTDFAREHLTYDLIRGFDGAAAAKDIKVVERYVLGINKDCL